MEINEQELERSMQCPIMHHVASKTHGYISAVTQWALRRSFERKFGTDPKKGLEDIRSKMISLWKDFQMEGDPGRIARIAGFKLFNLILDYEVIHPEQPYNLVLTGYTIQGKYALLRKRKGEELPYVLVLHANAPTLKKAIVLPPDIQSMARILHARLQDGYPNSQVLHYPVLTGRWWMNKTINPALARNCLQDMLKVVALRAKFPIVGEHCRSCDSQPCLEVFRNG